ncbi:MAG: GNAT family N-acetyltransferase [Spirochaetia bacterium]|jgi:hypothetical protein|nr:GNAT family N-acetyltransferase [Spirochaetia bacterium]
MITNDWNLFLEKIPRTKKDLYFTQEYSRLYEDEHHRAMAFVYEENDSTFVFPMLLSPVPESGGLYDFETPYGYGGPVSNSAEGGFFDRAAASLIKEAKDAGILAGLIRFHPLLDNVEFMKGSFPVSLDRETVYMDLEADETSIWTDQIHGKNRNAIRKAIEQGMEFEVDDSFSRIREFALLYDKTMKRLNAEEFYFFDEPYFLTLAKAFEGKGFLANVLKDGALASSAIILHDEDLGHYHLSGSDPELLKANPNNFMLYRAALELKRRGAKKFHLGGGSDSDPKNSLLAFKKKFSSFSSWFFIAKPVFLKQEYEEICERWEAKNPLKIARYANYVLKYRY